MSDLAKKIIISLLLFLTITIPSISLFAPSVKADIGPWYNQDPREWYNKVYNSGNDAEIFGERYAAAQVDWIIYSILGWLPTKILGPELINCIINSTESTALQTCLTPLVKFLSYNNSPQKLASSNESIAELILEDRPLSGIHYIKEVLRKFDIIPEAKAQSTGFGYVGLNSVLKFWGLFRNAAYFLFILIILAMAFMIMFKVKISPQTVITVQSALPKVVVALILVTFSYAIAGFAVDLMYVVIGLLGLVFSPGQVTGYFSWATNGPLNSGLFGILTLYVIAFTIVLLISIFFSNGIAGLITGVVVNLFTGGTPAMLALLIGLLASLIVLVIILWNSFKIWWMFTKTFAVILLLTIISPIQILLGLVVPSQGFGSWLRNFLANLAVYPVAITLFTFANAFLVMAVSQVVRHALNIQNYNPLGSQFWGDFLGGVFPGLNTFVSNGWPPLLAVNGGAISLLFLGVSFVIITIIPRTAELVQSIIRGQQFNYGTAIGEAVNFVYGPAKEGAVGEAGYRIGREAKLREKTAIGIQKTFYEGIRRWAERNKYLQP